MSESETTGPLYTLVYRGIEVGAVQETYVDFPGASGTFSPAKGASELSSLERVFLYMAYSREADRLMDMDQETGGDGYDEYMSANEPQFIDLIECDDWCLVDAAGKEHPILVPVFYADGGIGWRSAPRGGTPREHQTRRLTSGDEALGRRLFLMMAEVFEEEAEPLDDDYLSSLLSRSDFWAFAVVVHGETVGGLTAHTLPMTRARQSEVLIYDIAVREEFRRQGLGRELVEALRAAAREVGITDVFVAADDEDTHALDFYRALGGVAAPVTFFSFTDE
ncbi:Hypothetical protein A7982_08521 [Minicystis rosea]|nr:Hypothetical protein A7982_08521 [Minicystis rosea]